MNCETAKDLLVLLNCGELNFEDEEVVETHLESCPACSAERRRLQRLDSLLELQPAVVSPDLLARCRRDLPRDWGTKPGGEPDSRRRHGGVA